jgi:hypothetical protein
LAGDTARAATSGEVKDLRREARALKEVVAEHALELRLVKKKHDRGMRYPKSSGHRKTQTFIAGMRRDKLTERPSLS